MISAFLSIDKKQTPDSISISNLHGTVGSIEVRARLSTRKTLEAENPDRFLAKGGTTESPRATAS
jgi:hypothetical protein